MWATAAVDPTADFTGVECVFGYGSLTWKPCCAPDRIEAMYPAAIRGFRRRFWQHSMDHRGTPHFPGRVVTLISQDHPDSHDLTEEPTVVGMVYQVRQLASILPELDYRERNGYTRTVVPTFHPATGEALGTAILYLAFPGNDPAYVGPQKEEDLAAIISRAVGPSGENCEYLFNLDAWCRAHGIADGHVTRLACLTRDLLSCVVLNGPSTRDRLLASRVIASETKLEAKWLRALQLTYINGRGHEMHWDAVERTTRRAIGFDGVEVITLLDNFKGTGETYLVLVLQFRPPTNSVVVEFPAGLVDAGESAAAAALRELQEETGLVGSVTDVSPIVVSEPGLTNSNGCIVTATVDGKASVVAQTLDESEFIQVLAVPLRGLLKTLNALARDGLTIDAKVFCFAKGLELAAGLP